MGEEVVNCVVVASEAHEATVSENNTVNDELATEGAVEDVPMELETPQNANKRARDEDPQEDNDNGDDQSKKQRVEESGGSQQNGAEKSVEETRLIEKDAQEADERKGDAEVDDGSLKEKEGGENGEGDEQKGGENEEGDEQNEGVVVGDDGKANEEEEEEKQKVGPVKLGPKVFNTSKEMFDYFYKFMHHWPLNLGVNKYEHMVLRELLLQGHHEPDKKVGSGIEAFQIRVHPMFQSRCYFLIRKDGSMDDFSYRKCVDSLLPLPENMRTSGNNLGSHGQKNNRQSKQGQGGWGGGRGGGGGGGNRGGGRGGWHGGGHGRHGGRGRGGRGRS